jgi:hypothetical protein
MPVTLDDARTFALTLPRTTEGVVHGRLKLRIGRIVYLDFDRDETVMGFAHPKEERDALIASDPAKFQLPRPSDLRYNWVAVRLAALELDELRELVYDAWRFVVPKRVAADFEARHAANAEGSNAVVPQA